MRLHGWAIRQGWLEAELCSGPPQADKMSLLCCTVSETETCPAEICSQLDFGHGKTSSGRAQHAGKTLPLPQALPTQPGGTLTLGGSWAVCKHPGEEKMQPPAIAPRASCACQLHPITARLMVFALIKAPDPGAMSILKTKVLLTLRKSLKIYLVEHKALETERQGK